MKLEDKVAIVRRVQKLGMKAKPEVSMMIGAGGGTHVVGYKTKMRLSKMLQRKRRLTLKWARRSDARIRGDYRGPASIKVEERCGEEAC